MDLILTCLSPKARVEAGSILLGDFVDPIARFGLGGSTKLDKQVLTDLSTKQYSGR
jgi:hypothetical protein